MLLNIFILIISLFLSLIVTSVYIKLAKYYRLTSKPHSGGVRQDIVPTAAGIAFGLLYCLIIITIDQIYVIPTAYKYSILFGGGLIAITGFLDDLYELSGVLRLCIQFAFILLISYFFDIHNLISNYERLFIIVYGLPALFFLVWLINTFNFIDGADGLVSCNSVIFALFGGLYLYLSQEHHLATCLWSLCAINLGFLYFNWSPAKVFMGDSGSLFLGSIFVIFMLGSTINNQIPIYTWLILFSTFYVETTVVLFVRVWRKRNVFKEHHSLHAYQRQVITSGDHGRPAKISIIINFFWTVPLSYLCFLFPIYGLQITAVALVPLSFIFYFYGPYQVNPRGR